MFASEEFFVLVVFSLCPDCDITMATCSTMLCSYSRRFQLLMKVQRPEVRSGRTSSVVEVRSKVIEMRSVKGTVLRTRAPSTAMATVSQPLNYSQ